MAAPIFIGDELSAAGYRLAGVRVWTPEQEELPELFHQALQEAELVLIQVEYARRLPAAEVRQAQARVQPQLLIVPDLRGRYPMRDLLTRIQQQLGMHL